MVDWRQSLPQIIAAIIGSSLLVTALSSINSLIFRPIIAIDIVPHPLDYNVANMSYEIYLKNIGYSPATHLRLTMSYPYAKILGTIIEHADENMTALTYDTPGKGSGGNSVVAFLPRLVSGASVSIGTDIARDEKDLTVYNSTNFFDPLSDYSNSDTYPYEHYQPYSIIATYDQGSTQYTPAIFQYPINTEVLQSLILILLAFLSFAIPLRHKRRSSSKFASGILKDLMNVQKELKDDNPVKPSGKIFSFHAEHLDADTEHHIINDYKDYLRIKDFYTALQTRNCKLLQNQIDHDTLSQINKQCFNQAIIAYTQINWRKFHKLDLILLIPAVILGSLFITYVCEGLPLSFVSVELQIGLDYTIRYHFFPYIIPASLILRWISSYFITRLILKSNQGVIINKYGIPSVFRSFAFLFFSFVMIGIPSSILLDTVLSTFDIHTRGQIHPFPFPILSANDLASNFTNILYVTVIFVIFDIGRMFLLTVTVWRLYTEGKIKVRPRRLFRKQRLG
jgi:hypothetical protein